MIDFDKLPKIDLHVHVDGSVRPSTVVELLNNPYPDKVAKLMRVDKDTISHAEYMRKFDLPTRVMQSKSNLTRIAMELAEDLKADGVIYAEAHLSPARHTQEGLAMSDVIKAVLAGFKKVDGIKVNLILCMQREDNENDNRRIIRLAKLYHRQGVCGVGLVGNEKKYPNRTFGNLFKYAKSQNVNFTVHAGEEDGADSVKGAIDLGVKRIGHGVRVIENEYIESLLKEKNIALEVCPNSNIDVGIYSNYKDHPVKKLYDYGIKVTIGSNCRTVSNITLTTEYQNLYRYLGFSLEDFVKMNEYAIDASFMSDNDKKKYRKLLKESIFKEEK